MKEEGNASGRLGFQEIPRQMKRPGGKTMTGLLWPSIPELSLCLHCCTHRADPTDPLAAWTAGEIPGVVHMLKTCPRNISLHPHQAQKPHYALGWLLMILTPTWPGQSFRNTFTTASRKLLGWGRYYVPTVAISPGLLPPGLLMAFVEHQQLT